MGWDEYLDEPTYEFTDSELAEHDAEVRSDARKEALEGLWKKICASKRTAIEIFGYSAYVTLADVEYMIEKYKEQK